VLPAPLFALFYQGDVDGRIIFNGFATAKNFGDWILNFSGHSRQVKMRAKIIPRILLIQRELPVSHFSTGFARQAAQDGFRGFGINVNGTKLGRLAVLREDARITFWSDR